MSRWSIAHEVDLKAVDTFRLPQNRFTMTFYRESLEVFLSSYWPLFASQYVPERTGRTQRSAGSGKRTLGLRTRYAPYIPEVKDLFARRSGTSRVLHPGDSRMRDFVRWAKQQAREDARVKLGAFELYQINWLAEVAGVIGGPAGQIRRPTVGLTSRILFPR